MNKLYTIGFTPTSIKHLSRLDKVVAERVLAKLLRMARLVDVIQHEAMTGEWKGRYRFRVGDYRVVYWLEHEERLIFVEAIGHRRDVYD
jgi:mRNA interferase RelE/StbE